MPHCCKADKFIRVLYKHDSGYDVLFYVVRARTDTEVVPYTYLSPYTTGNDPETVEVDVKRFTTSYNSEVVSQLITLSSPFKF